MDDLTASPQAPVPSPVSGLFWPGQVRFGDARYERFDGFILLRVRHLPTAATLAMARKSLGFEADPALDAWKAIWDRSCPDIEAYAGALGHVEPGARLDARKARHRSEFARLMDTGARGEALGELLGMTRFGGEGPVRDVAMHVLEDAVMLTSLAEAGVPFRLNLCFPPGDPNFRVAEYGPGGAFLREPDEVEDKACMARADWQASALNPDWASAGFVAASGRGHAVCRGYADTVATLLDMALQGHVRAFLKHAIPKRGTWVVDLSAATDFASVSARLLSAVGTGAADLFEDESPLNSFVVQEHAPFTHEHRFYCVGHRVVASSASVRSLSLLDTTGRILDPRIARLRVPAGAPGHYDRGESYVVEDRRLVARMALMARSLARRIRYEGRFHGHYAIDVGLTGNDVAAIEVNTFTNAGLYAVDVGRIARSLGRWYAEPDRQPAGGFVESDPLSRTYRLLFKVIEEAEASGLDKARGLVARVASAVTGRRRPASPKAESVEGAAGAIDSMVSMMAWRAVSAGELLPARADGAEPAAAKGD